MEKDIIDSQAHEAQTSKILKHTWDMKLKPNAEEIKDRALITWGDYDKSLIQVQKKSDPIYSSAYEEKKIGADGREIIEYPVQEGYPLDGDIIDSQKHLGDQETQKKHKIVIPTSKNIQLGEESDYKMRRNMRKSMMNNWGTSN